MKKIAILTSGGDSQGMNAAVRAVTLAARKYGMSVVGVYDGYIGILQKKFKDLAVTDVTDVINKGGTFLKTVRFKEFKDQENVRMAAEICKEEGIEGLVVIGGDGSFRGACDMTKLGIPTVAIPGTIDNDLGCTEYTIGFDTAVNVAMEAIDKIRDTSSSHYRCGIAVVMGRDAGWIALNTGIAVGAVYTLVREVPFRMEDIYEKIKKAKAMGQTDFAVVCAEGIFAKPDEKKKEVNPAYEYLASLGMETPDTFAKALEKATGVECRATVLGHMQRGGSPTLQDRKIATEMGWRCAELLHEGKSDRVVVVRDGKITDLDILEALKMKKEFDLDLYRKVNELSI